MRCRLAGAGRIRVVRGLRRRPRARPGPRLTATQVTASRCPYRLQRGRGSSGSGGCWRPRVAAHAGKAEGQAGRVRAGKGQAMGRILRAAEGPLAQPAGRQASALGRASPKRGVGLPHHERRVGAAGDNHSAVCSAWGLRREPGMAGSGPAARCTCGTRCHTARAVRRRLRALAEPLAGVAAKCASPAPALTPPAAAKRRLPAQRLARAGCQARDAGLMIAQALQQAAVLRAVRPAGQRARAVAPGSAKKPTRSRGPGPSNVRLSSRPAGGGGRTSASHPSSRR